ncbi:LacI family DNA-binding transcriptional regulator [Halonatronum saccharophilum]|uniref:LacI family DNA-binding transcriptional regulator n=1 Tax=Halonatronum saccharophilum TaxID=150060 RepID=UPI0004873DE1|nr:LacI family DNA-binding transcriptional regulator [Halonatronum saccharophilum]
MKKVTIYDVAEWADVGIGTVSRVLNNSERVSDKTREKVLEAIKELNYQPNAMARGLALQKTGSIGVIVPCFTHHFFVEVLKGVQEELQQIDLDLVLFNVENKEQKDKHIDRILKERRVDGVLAITLSMTKKEVKRFKDLNLPLVLVNDLQDEVSSIFVNDFSGAKEAIEYLIDLGHKKIAFLNGSLRSKQAKERLRGVKAGFKAKGLKLDENLYKEGQFTEESGYKLMEQLLKETKDRWPSAVFAASDNQAIGALQAIEESGLKVPEDFALIGYDNIELARYLKLTTVSQPMTKMGRLGVEILAKEINSKQLEVVQKELEPELIIRRSC